MDDRFLDRRSCLKLAAPPMLPPMAEAQTQPVPIIDSHIHLFDTTRPQGVPYPNKNNPKIYKPALPAGYRAIAEPFGVVGAIEVEASPWIEDNLWVLETCDKDTIMVGMI